MIGFIGAMDQEVAQLVAELSGRQDETIAGMVFHKGRLSGKEVIVVQSGIGKVNAAICTQILALKYGVEAVINTGIAGSLRAEINIGDIVLSTDAVQHDMDATGFGYGPGIIPGMKDCSYFAADERLRKLAEEVCRKELPELGIFCGRVVSGDQFISDRATKDRLIQTFAGYCTEMEGAAIAQAAYLNKIPFLIIRAISDKADDSAHMDYGEFEKKAIAHSVTLVKALLAAM